MLVSGSLFFEVWKRRRKKNGCKKKDEERERERGMRKGSARCLKCLRNKTRVDVRRYEYLSFFTIQYSIHTEIMSDVGSSTQIT